uniref:Uncharacterized protein n=1 Tax=uncultured marine virus TaxID=186617 RepID=A0A0F7L7X8_9VIRU|nr:hypothetical protein [uncultured marine virus]
MIRSYKRDSEKQTAGNLKMYLSELPNIDSITLNSSSEITNISMDDGNIFKNQEFDRDNCEFINANTAGNNFNSNHSFTVSFSGKQTELINNIDEIEKAIIKGIAIIRIDNNKKGYLSGWSKNVKSGYTKLETNYESGKTIADPDKQRCNLVFTGDHDTDEIPLSDTLTTAILDNTSIITEPFPLIEIDTALETTYLLYLHSANGDTYTVDYGDGTSEVITCSTLDSNYGTYKGTVSKTYTGSSEAIRIKSSGTNYTNLKGIGLTSAQDGVLNFKYLEDLEEFVILQSTSSDLEEMPTLPANNFLVVSVDNTTLTEIDISNITGLGNLGINDNTSLTSLLLPENITYLGSILYYTITDSPSLVSVIDLSTYDVEDLVLRIQNTAIESVLLGANVVLKTDTHWLNGNALDGSMFDNILSASDDNFKLYMQDNGTIPSGVDNVLNVVNAKFTGDNGELSLTGNSVRTSASNTAVSDLTGRSWTLLLDT